MTLRIALIGAGAMGRQHGEIIAQEPQAELCAIADPSEAARAFASECNVAWFDDHDALLAEAHPDAVIVANPNHLHVATTLDCLRAGVPALIEKPLGVSLDEVRPLVAAERDSDIPLLVGHHRRHNPLIGKARELLQSGALGQLTTITALWQLLKPDSYFDAPWRREPGSGMLHTNLIHDLDLLRHLCGEVASVQAMTSQAMRGFNVADTVTVMLRFDNGALATLSASDTTSAPWSWELASGENPEYPHQAGQPCYLFAGTRGALSLPELRHWFYAGDAHWKAPLSETRLTRDEGSALQHQLGHFISVAKGETTPLIGVEDAARTLALIDAVEKAAASGHGVAPERP